MAERGVELRDYVSVLWARKRYVVAVLALVVAGAIFYSYRETPMYESFAQVLVQPISFFTGSPPSSSDFVDMFTEQQVASSRAVALEAEKQVGSRGLTPGGISVSVPTSTSTLLFNASSPSPRAAQVSAQAYADAYLGFRLRQAQQEQQALTKPIEDRLAAVNGELADVQTQLTDSVSPEKRSVLNVQLNSLLSERSTLQQQLNNLVPALQLRVGQVLQPAFLPGGPSSPDYRKNIALGILAGLLLGVGVAVLRDLTDQRVRDRQTVEHEAGAPVLAMVPRVRMRQDASRRELITLSSPNSLAAEAHKQLRTSLLVASAERGYKTILVTSPNAEEGKTATVANLGVVLAQAGKRTVMVSADLRRPTLHLYFAGRARPGLAEVLTGQIDLRDALQPVYRANNLFLVPGREVGGSSELLGSDAMKRTLWQLQEDVDFLLIDAAPILGVSDAIAMVPTADAVLLVVRANATTRGAIREARHQLNQVDARVMGAVLTSVDPSSHPYASGYYRYSHREPPEEPAPVRPVPTELHSLSSEP
jgi:tyrosine-protein kinase